MNARFTLSFFVSCLAITSLFGQLNYKWSNSVGSAQNDFAGTMLLDTDDNLYMVNQIRDTADLDPGAGTDLTYPIYSDVVVLTKLDPEGQYRWSGRFHSIGFIAGNLLEIENDQLYLTVRFTDSLVYIVHGERQIVYYDKGVHMCMLTLSLDGHVMDTRYYTSNHPFGVNKQFTLSNGQTFLCGSFEDTLAWPGAPVLVSVGKRDLFYMLLNESNEPLWAISMGSSQNEFPGSYVMFDETTCYFTFSHVDTIVLNTTSGTRTFPAEEPYNTIIGGINLQGEIVHAFAQSGEGANEVYTIVLDKDEYVYLGGYYRGTINFAHPTQTPVWYTPVNSDDGFIAKYTPDGLLQWVNVYISDDYSYITHLVIERDTDLYAGGGIAGLSDLDPGPDSLLILAEEDSDIFLAKLQLNGSQAWAYHLYGSDTDGLTQMLVSDTRSEVILGGFYYDTLDCDPTENEALLVTRGGTDIFRIVFSEETVMTAVDDVIASSNFTVYPNPASDHIRIESEDEIEFITLQTTTGQFIRTENHMNQRSGEFDLQNLAAGMYVITVYGKNSMQSQLITRM